MASATASSIPTRQRKRLRYRIIVSVLAIGTLLSGLFAVYAVMLRGYLEDRLIGRTLESELKNFVDLYYQDPTAVGLPFSKITGRVYAPDKCPPNWASLENGVHRLIETDDKSGQHVAYKLAVYKDPDRWFFLKYDVTAEERTRRAVALAIAGSVIAFSVLSLLLGIWSSSRIMSPVLDLVRRVQKLGRRGTRPESLAPHFAEDEVGTLARSLDDYSDRLTKLVERDREFNNDVSHELRTPLAVVRSTTELLLSMPDLQPKVMERLQRIERAAKQSTELIEALLHLSRAERQSATDGEFTAVEKLLPAIIDAHRPQLQSKPVTVELEVRAPLQVNAPEAVLSVALGNLVGNAFKYTREGVVRIMVDARQVVVTDSGPGITAEELEKVFERHFRGSSATGNGAGLGLAIVRRLCELYGWSVALEPNQGGGVRACLRMHELKPDAPGDAA